MPFKKRLLRSEIAFALSVGLFLAASPKSADAQLPQYSCRPNDGGDGGICENTGPIEAPNTADGNDRYNSPGAVLPDGTGSQRRPSFQFPIQLPEDPAEESAETDQAEDELEDNEE